jgi:predicted ATP-dependent serine protease
MAAAPWRCSQCGTINEPVANSCRTCGRWPSLFDLQDSVVDEVSAPVVAERTAFEAETVEPEPFQAETFEPEPVEAEELPEEAEAPESSSDRRRRILTSLIVPLAFVAYIVISIIFGDNSG